ncbi:MAG: Membrane protein-like protein [Parcubacteria group bacterium GW2011_GWB1_49_7]|nr:MAG: Membrane protein-like protein [Parcubacteria group bacterium GW2011_GWA1_47_10]KKW09836.1 MAG: Membrane protein-like protein [Parcubacteria group bacterium GW2011_GWB1_49_7]
MEYKHNPPTLQELRRIFTVLTNGQYKPHHAVLTRSERFAVYMHRRIGSLGFFCLILAWTVLWLAWNMFAPIEMRFDPAPAFVIWLFASNILQLVLLPVIMVGQNIEGRAAEWRAQKDFEVDRQAQQEIEVIIAHLENQNELLLELARKIDRK